MTNFFKKSFVINPNKFPFFYGYIILIFGTIGVLFSIPGQTVGVSVFTNPVKDALQLTRNQFSNAYMIGTLISAFFVTKAGKLFDKFGAKIVAFLAAFFLAIALLVFSISEKIIEIIQNISNSKTWLIAFVLLCFLFFLIRFFGQGVLTMSSRNVIMMWFDKNRGKVNAFSSIAVSLGFSAAPILLDFLITKFGWQLSWQILAYGLFVFSIFIFLFFKNKPEDYHLIPDGYLVSTKQREVTPLEESFTLDEAKKSRAFWMFGLLLAYNSFFVTGFTFHVVSIFESVSLTKSEAISIFLPMSIIAIVISTTANILSDYLQHKIYLFMMIIGGLIAAFGLLTLNTTFGMYFLIIGLGVSSGLFAVINAVTWPRYFGRKHLGAITGKVASFLVIASALAPSMFSYTYSIFGSYLFIAVLLIIFLTFLGFASINFKKPSKRTLIK